MTTAATPSDKGSFRVVKAHVRTRIESGAWGPETVLPGEVELAATFGCARATVSRAMRELAEEGIVERRRKAGTRVRAVPLREARFSIPIVRDQIAATGNPYRYRLVAREVLAAAGRLGQRLGLEPGAEVLRLTCLHSAGPAPWQVEDRWISLAALPQAAGADFTRHAPTEWLIAAVPYSQVEVSFLAATCDARTGPLLAMNAGEPVFVAERTTWWQGRAITHVRLTHARGYRMTTRY